MTMTRYRQQSQYGMRPFAHLFDDFFNDSQARHAGQGRQANFSPRVNITEDEDAFHLDFAAPGYAKNDFSVAVDHNVLTVKADHVENTHNTEGATQNDAHASTEGHATPENGEAPTQEHAQTQNRRRVLKQEFSARSFERSFTLPQTVNVDAIDATYEAGILHVSLPKREETRAKSRSVSIR